ncbi:PepSY domain-containing protein, partial [Psychrobacter sp. 16-Bac2893]
KDKHYKNEDSIKNESRYPAIKRRAINKVEGMGYRVKDIEFEQKNNRGVFEIEAKRGSQEYEITLGYPNLNVIKIKKD